jgi:CheY-like chemotaxis protein
MGSRVVLLVDDDPLVRFTIEGLVSELGFNVIEAEGGAQ